MGYNTNLFVSTVDPNLVCNICTCVMDTSVVTLCGHSFCHSCLSTWLSRPESESCPVCRSYTSRYEIIPNLSIRNIIKELPVWCINKEHGCNIVTKLENLETHTTECRYRIIECAACKQNVRQCDLTNHCLSCSAITMENQITNSSVATTAETTREKMTIELLSRKMTVLELELKQTKKQLQASQQNVNELEIEISELREQTATLNNPSPNRDFDPDYGYGYSPSSISQLSCLISKYLLSKPSHVDTNRIFMAIKRSFTYYHNYAGYSEDVHMLLTTAYASNWFQEHHRWSLERWLEQITSERFPRNTQPLQTTYSA